MTCIGDLGRQGSSVGLLNAARYPQVLTWYRRTATFARFGTSVACHIAVTACFADVAAEQLRVALLGAPHGRRAVCRGE